MVPDCTSLSRQNQYYAREVTVTGILIGWLWGSLALSQSESRSQEQLIPELQKAMKRGSSGSECLVLLPMIFPPKQLSLAHMFIKLAE